ncbi:MAG: nitroreductase family protein [Candidatus Microthrix sp.]|nr:nitroreductase family protein [Candidatus Microthrix sp.]
MQLYDAMSTLRGRFGLRPDPIPDVVLDRVLAACWAPTGGNTQPWKVIVATDPDVRARAPGDLSPGMATLRRAGSRRLDLASRRRGRTGSAAVRAGDHLANHPHEAPAILVFVPTRRRWPSPTPISIASAWSAARSIPAVQTPCWRVSPKGRLHADHAALLANPR